MAHDNNGHIYIDTNTTPNTGISVSEVASVLGANAGEELCSHGNVKRWPKNKPVRFNSYGILTDAQRASVAWGINAPEDQTTTAAVVANQLTAFRAAAQDAGNNSYKYLKPVPGTHPCRLLDFDGYRHHPVSPLRGTNIASVNLKDFSSGFQWNISKNDDTDGSISLSDLVTKFGLSDYYLAIGVEYNGAFFYKTSSTTLGTFASSQYQGLLQIGFTEYDFQQVLSGASRATVNFFIVASSAQCNGTVLNPASGTYHFRPLPFDVKTTGYGSITISNYWPLECKLLYVGQNAPDTTKHFSDYTFAGNYEDEDGERFNLLNNGTFTFCVKMTYNGSGDVNGLQLTGDNFELLSSLNAVDWTAGVGTGKRKPTKLMYASSENGQLQEIDPVLGHIYLPKNTPVYVAVYIEDFYGFVANNQSAQALTTNINGGLSQLHYHYDGAEVDGSGITGFYIKNNPNV